MLQDFFLTWNAHSEIHFDIQQGLFLPCSYIIRMQSEKDTYKVLKTLQDKKTFLEL